MKKEGSQDSKQGGVGSPRKESEQEADVLSVQSSPTVVSKCRQLNPKPHSISKTNIRSTKSRSFRLRTKSTAGSHSGSYHCALYPKNCPA